MLNNLILVYGNSHIHGQVGSTPVRSTIFIGCKIAVN